jgi:hypothetical protein
MTRKEAQRRLAAAIRAQRDAQEEVRAANARVVEATSKLPPHYVDKRLAGGERERIQKLIDHAQKASDRLGRAVADVVNLRNFLLQGAEHAAQPVKRARSGDTRLPKKSHAQIAREVDEILSSATKRRPEGYRVAYTLVTRRDGKIVSVRAIVNAPRPLTLAEAEAWRRKWGRTANAWVETMEGVHVPVKGAMRPGPFVDDARQGEAHASLTR